MAKRLELLKEALPHVRRVAFLLNPDHAASGPTLRAMEEAAKLLRLTIQTFEVRDPSELGNVFSAMATGSIDAVAITEQPLFVANAKIIASFALKQRLPSTGFNEFAEAGGLIAYGVNLLELYRRAAYFVDKILKGAKPRDLPVEQATQFSLVINGKTAKAINIKIANSILARADKVIE